MVCVATTATVKAFIKQLEEVGCETHLDLSVGTAEATLDGHVVYKAIQKGANNPMWIVRTVSHGHIKWV